jgi:predicted signal transduction protein with EAL and GGDEF domain
MFDHEHKLIVCNKVYRELYGLSEDQTKSGTTFQAIQESRIASGNVHKDSVDNIQKRIAEVSEAYTIINQLSDGRFVSVIHQPIAGGGWVATHEDITERKLAESRIEQLAHYDALTNLANRHLFQERLEQLLALLHRNGAEFALFLLDLDRFKAVNDALGHYAGDVLLKDAGALVKGEDVACGSGQCYTVSTTLSPDELGLSGPGAGAVAGLPIDLTGATVKVTVAVEKALPYHLASVTAVLTTPDGNAVTVVATASKWDQPVTVTVPSPDQIKPAS